MLRRVRIAVQLASLALFLYLLARTVGIGEDQLGPPVRIFLEIDPLIGITTWLRTGALHGLLPLSLATLALAFLLGRSFCGWICPLGTLSQASGRLRRPRATEKTADRYRPSQRWKVWILLAVLASSAAGFLVTGILDPITILVRSLALGLGPAMESTIRAGANGLAATPAGGVTDRVYFYIRDHAMAPHPPRFEQGMLLTGILILLLGLAWIRKRFWCRTLCPLGALLGICAHAGTLRLRQDDVTCTSCALCTFHCQGAADPHKPGGWRASECFVCGNCTAACTRNGLSFTIGSPRIARTLGGWIPRRRAPARRPLSLIHI
ncbi:MAG: 4Fe-4S binding protein [Candidatus Eisenbacteria bacterium]|nr:4Fe-4S binding protein [Candidatus Eisenbacteria bacterium]